VNSENYGKILVVDIETTDLKGNYGHMLMWAAKWVGSDDIYYMRIDDTEGFGTTPKSFVDDKALVIELIDLVNEADALVYHYGDRFDLPFLNTRALEWSLLPPSKVTGIDTWKVGSQNLAMTSNRLKSLAEFLNDEEHQKDELTRMQWKLARFGHKPSLDAMLEYNIKDVLATEEIYLKLRPVMKTHPYIGRVDADKDARRMQCPACASIRTKLDGTRRTKIYLVHRGRCNDCGSCFEVSRERVAP
jgi:uncharacterized protein YprB with RNaseH-like and TPR domain